MQRSSAIVAVIAALIVGLTAGAIAALIATDSAGETSDKPPKPAPARQQPTTEATPPDTGHFRLKVDRGDVKKHRGAAAVIKDAELSALVRDLDEAFLIPRNVTIHVTDDPDEAYYDPESRRIVISPELISDMAIDMSKAYDSKKDGRAAAASNLTFFVLHEVGHALVDLLDLPITGMEENAVDQLAAVIMIDFYDDPIVVLESSDLFDWWAEDPEEEDFYDEHDLDQQRFFHLRCMVYGSDPKKFAEELKGLGVTTDRKDLCIDDSKRITDSWMQLLDPYFLDEEYE